MLNSNELLKNTPKHTMPNLQIFGNQACIQCAAKSKRTGQQCKGPAVKGKAVCRMHGGKSTGPQTPEGIAKCAGVKTIHGEETREAREQNRQAKALLRYLEDLGFAYGFMSGKRTPGRRS